MLIKKGYVIIALAIVSVLVGSLFYNNITLADRARETTEVEIVNLPIDEQGNLKVKLAEQQFQTYKDSVKIPLVNFKSDNYLALLEFNAYPFPFTFNPKASSFNVTDCWVIFELNALQGRKVQYKMNGIALAPESLPDTTDETYYVRQITNQSFRDAIRLGINILTMAFPVNTNQVQINHMAIFIEYNYQA